MRYLTRLFVVVVFLPSLAWTTPANAQTSRPAPAQTLSQAERMAVELKQGMTSDEVQKLLGKPRRTALRNNGGYSNALQGTLQWTYSWAGTSTSPASLTIEFVAKMSEQWYVSSWDWGTSY
jgi:hypothetical protein